MNLFDAAMLGAGISSGGGTGEGSSAGSGVSQSYVDSRDNAIFDAAKNYADSVAEKINVKNAIACDGKPAYVDGSITYVKGGVTYTTADTDTWFYYNDGEELKQTIFVDGEEFTITSAGKVDFTEFVADSDVTSTYTGNEGDTSKIPNIAALRMLDSKIIGNISNPNLLINPDFRVNQRGLSEYSTIHKYTVDRWILGKAGNDTDVNNRVISNSAGGITLSFNSGNWIRIGQIFENPIVDTVTITVNIESAVSGMQVLILANDNGAEVLISKTLLDGNKTTIVSTYTPTSLTRVSVDVRGAFGDIKIKNVKMEYSSIATPFIPPDPATELVKCQRYYQLHTSGDINPVDLRPNMRIVPTITQLSDGNYAYDAEIY